MPSFLSDNVNIAYEVHGEGEPVLLIHGFASNIRINWQSTGWIDLLAKAGRQVIAIDNRGHGNSDKPHDPVRYTSAEMARDSSRLIDHLGHERVDVMGYSMGARLSAMLGIHHSEQVRSLVLGGLAGNMISGVIGAEEIVAALQAPSLDEARGVQGKAFRAFAEQTGSDLEALAACMASQRTLISEDELAQIKVPDPDRGRRRGRTCRLGKHAGGGDPVLPRASFCLGKDHMKAVGDKTYKLSVLDFLDRRP